MEAVKFRSSRIPVLGRMLGPVVKGSIIVIAGTPETYPHVLGAEILKEAIRVREKSALILLGDSPDDYFEMLESMGVSRLSLEELLSVDIVDNVSRTVSMVAEEAGRGAETIVADLRGASELGPGTMRGYAERLRRTPSILYLILDPGLLGAETLSWIARLSEAFILLEARRTEEGYERRAILYSSRRPRRDFSVTYRVSETGISFETTSRL